MEDLAGRLVSRAEIARLAGVRRPAVSNWERRHPGTFPGPVSAGEDGTELFRAVEVANWLGRRAIPANARRNGEPAGTTYGDRFRSGLGTGTAERRRAPDPVLSPRTVEELLVRWQDIPPPEYVEMLLALLHLRGRRPDIWERVYSQAVGPESLPEAAELHRLITQGLPGPLPPAGAQVWQERDGALTEAIRLVGEAGGGERGECVAAFDHLLQEFAMTRPTRVASEFLTPPSVARTAAGLLTQQLTEPTEAHDPFCRTGEMLAAVADSQAASNRKRPLRISGAGVPDSSLRLARLNLSLRGHDPAGLVRGAASPSETPAPLRHKVDILVANPPFNVRSPGPARHTGHWRYGPPPPHRANFDWLQYAVDSLSPAGRACVVMTPNASFSNDHREKTIRSAMVEDGVVECVVELPPGLFSATGIAVMLWLLRPPAGRCGDVLFITARAMGAMVTRTVRTLSGGESGSIAHEYRAWRAGGAYTGVPGFSRAVGPDELRRSDYDLSPSRYVPPEVGTGDVTTHRARLGSLRGRLARLHAEAAEVDASVESILRRHDI